MARIFIVWSSKEGQTRRIVQAIEKEIRDADHKLETINADDPPRGWIFTPPDAVLVAASVHMGKHTEGLEKMLKAQSKRLETLPSAFLSVSLSAADEKTQADADRYVAELTSATGWTPRVTATVAGALRYPEYPFFKRMMIKKIAKKMGLPTDTRQVHEFTDWDKVRAFAKQVIALAEQKELQHA